MTEDWERNEHGHTVAMRLFIMPANIRAVEEFGVEAAICTCPECAKRMTGAKLMEHYPACYAKAFERGY
jgi:hypothetical protein